MSGAQPQPHAQQEDESRQQQSQQTGTSLPLPPQVKSPVTLPPHAQTPPPTASPQPHAQPQPQPQPYAQPQAEPQPQPEPHRPPQAYPAPPVTPPSAPPTAPPTVGGAASGQGQEAYGQYAEAGSGSGTGTGNGDGGSGTEGTDTGTTILGRTAAPAAAASASAAGAVRRPRTGARTVPQTRKARLRVAKADPWSVMKVSFLLSIALGVCTIVAVGVLWTVMNAMGVFTAVSDTLGEATQTGSGGGFDVESFLSLPRVLGFTTVIALIDVVLATALATLGAFIYNLSAGFVGGVELTLAEDD